LQACREAVGVIRSYGRKVQVRLRSRSRICAVTHFPPYHNYMVTEEEEDTDDGLYAFEFSDRPSVLGEMAVT